jgi:crotonobetainyl-CoA:carnitine CoA-transferase CaiB-like acyl-CoA transferase
MAVGSDAQWQRLVAQPPFQSLARPDLATNEGRRAVKVALHAEIGAITAKHPAAEIAKALAAAQIPHAPITPIEKVLDLDFLQGVLLSTTTPDGKRVRLPPPAVATEWLDEHGREVPFAPAYGGDTDDLLAEIGIKVHEVEDLRARGVVA